MSKFYSFNRLHSYHSFINFSMGGRGIGKSYGAKEIVIEDFLNNSKQSMYVRRTQKEIDAVKQTYWNDIKNEYPDLEFEVLGEWGYINESPVVQFVALSTSFNRRSASTPNINKIIFDEYVLNKTTYKGYLKNEITVLLELAESVFRSRDDVKIYILSNAISYVNPFFDYFNIEPKKGQQFITIKDDQIRDNLIVVEIVPPKEEFVEEKSKTKFMRLMKNTDYYKYSVENKTLEDNSDFIEKERFKGKYTFICSFYYDNEEFSVWNNQLNGVYRVDNIIEKNSPHRYYLYSSDVQKGFRYYKEFKNEVSRIKRFKKNLAINNVVYMNQKTKNFVLDELMRWL